MVLLPHPDLLVHGQPGRLPHGREDGQPHQLGRRPLQPDRDRVRRTGRWLNSSVPEELQDLGLLPDVGVHVVPAPRPGQLHEGGHREGQGVERKIRISHRILHKRIR